MAGERGGISGWLADRWGHPDDLRDGDRITFGLLAALTLTSLVEALRMG